MEITSAGPHPPQLPDNPQTQVTGSGGNTLANDTEKLNTAAETAFASVFFSLLRNILSEAQNNSGS